MRQTRRGFALMAAMWLVVLIGVMGWELSLTSRARRLAAANTLDLVGARAAADAALVTVQAELQDSLAAVSGRPQSQTTLERDPWTSLRWSRTDTLHLGDERAAVSVYDAGTRLHLNRASVEDMRRFLIALEMDAGDADRLAQRIADWRDVDNDARARGAERTDYLRSGARRVPANANFGSLAELRDVDGMTPGLFDRMARYLTLSGVGQINLNAAAPAVLYSLPGFGDEAVAAVVRIRAERVLRSLDDVTRQLSRSAAEAITNASPELASRITFETREVVISADGWMVGGPVRAHREMVVARSGSSILVESRRSYED